MMLMFALGGTLVGAVLGLRFKVLILVPVIAGSSLAIVAGGLGSGHSVGNVLITTLLAGAGLQLGYLCGAVTRSMIAAANAPRLPSVEFAQKRANS